MNRFRKNLLSILVLIFAITIIGFSMTFFDGDAPVIAGNAVLDESGAGCTLLSVAVPGLIFIALLIIIVVYLEKQKD